jgi:hypothetical protein
MTGFHNASLTRSSKRLREQGLYRDNSTIIVTPTRADGDISVRVAESHAQLGKGMNQRVHKIIVEGKEVGHAFQSSVEGILAHPDLSKWKYLLTLEDDNIPPQNGLEMLWRSIEEGPFAAVGGLYWTKGYGGQPMIYGDPKVLTFLPQVVRPNTLQECNGLGMGFTLFRLDVFRHIDPPWFKTQTLADDGTLVTQDLYFFEKVRKAGYRVACDTRVRVGHYDARGDFGAGPGFVW